jgi:Reverse transcriptase (RNA-dependent DNA polymerase)
MGHRPGDTLMRSETVEKRLASIRTLACQGKRINGLSRLLACPLIWEQAYESIARNHGALTPGIDSKNTPDGFSLERIQWIIDRVMDGTYWFAPVRRLYIPKPDGRKRPLGIPTADDKLVQAAVKILLERVYEPVFSGNSHGFRKGHSCHTVLREIARTWNGVKWLVEVDVSGFFDNVDHDILLNLLRKRIDDDRLLRLIGRMLTAGYMEDWTYYETFSGTPQNGVISPILANQRTITRTFSRRLGNRPISLLARLAESQDEPKPRVTGRSYARSRGALATALVQLLETARLNIMSPEGKAPGIAEQYKAIRLAARDVQIDERVRLSDHLCSYLPALPELMAKIAGTHPGRFGITRRPHGLVIFVASDASSVSVLPLRGEPIPIRGEIAILPGGMRGRSRITGQRG